MDEYISREAAQDEACDRCNQQGHCNRPELCPVLISIKTIPAADVRPVKRGHWVKRMEEHTAVKYTSFTPIWSCSECGLEYDPALAQRIHFCYNCGSDLREYDHGI